MKQNLEPETDIEHRLVIDFTYGSELIDTRVFWEIVSQDRKGRWLPDDDCCTSFVLRELWDQLSKQRTESTDGKAEESG